MIELLHDKGDPMTLQSISNDYLSSNSLLTLNVLEPLDDLFESPNRVLHAVSITTQYYKQDTPCLTTFSAKGKSLPRDLSEFDNILECYQIAMAALSTKEPVHIQRVVVSITYSDHSFGQLKQFTAVISSEITYDLQRL
jgi:hypothetical protein